MTETPEINSEAVEAEGPPAETEPEASIGPEPSVNEALEREGRPAFARGYALDGIQAGEVAAERRATVIVLAGTQGSGKTTLLASLYDQLGRGPFGGHLFLGSRTLAGFERIRHRALQEVRRQPPFRGRTEAEPPPWMHLRLRRPERTDILELLLGDFPGEDFEALASGLQQPEDNNALWRADHVGIVLHGGMFALPEGRMKEQRAIKKILEVIVGTPEAIAGPEALTFIVSMWDLLEGAGNEIIDLLDGFIDELRAVVEAEFPGQSRTVGVIRTAGRSSDDALIPMGHGVDELLVRWSDQPALSFPTRSHLR